MTDFDPGGASVPFYDTSVIDNFDEEKQQVDEEIAKYYHGCTKSTSVVLFGQQCCTFFERERD